MLARLTGDEGANAQCPSYTLHYVQFQTQLLRFYQNAVLNELYDADLVKQLVKNLFRGQSAAGKPQLAVVWSLYVESKLMTMTVESTEFDSNNVCRLVIVFACQQIELMRAHIEVGGEAFIDVAAACDRELFSDNDLLDMVSHFSDVFKIKKMTLSAALEQRRESLALHDKLNGFHFRIKGIIDRSIRYINACYFDVSWQDARGIMHPLKASLCLSAPFYAATATNEPSSWVAEEKTILNTFSEYRRFRIPDNQFHYRLYVNEVVEDEEFNIQHQVELLTIWMTLDGLVGELFNVNKGSRLNGNDVLAIYLYFDNLFNIKSTFICDEAKIQCNETSESIPLRLIMALAIGKTWYQSRIPGIRLFECNQFPSVDIGEISQHPARRDAALADLQKLAVAELLTLVSPEYHSRLAVLQEKYQADNLQVLTNCIYTDSKQQKIVTPDLIFLTNILCNGIDPDGPEIKLVESDPDYWLKSRVRELLVRSRFWVKPQASLQDESQCARLLPR